MMKIIVILSIFGLILLSCCASVQHKSDISPSPEVEKHWYDDVDMKTELEEPLAETWKNIKINAEEMFTKKLPKGKFGWESETCSKLLNDNFVHDCLILRDMADDGNKLGQIAGFLITQRVQIWEINQDYLILYQPNVSLSEVQAGVWEPFVIMEGRYLITLAVDQYWHELDGVMFKVKIIDFYPQRKKDQIKEILLSERGTIADCWFGSRGVRLFDKDELLLLKEELGESFSEEILIDNKRPEIDDILVFFENQFDKDGKSEPTKIVFKKVAGRNKDGILLTFVNSKEIDPERFNDHYGRSLAYGDYATWVYHNRDGFLQFFVGIIPSGEYYKRINEKYFK